MVVVTYDSAEVLPGFVAALPDGMAGVSYELLIADNASSDATLDLAARLAPTARLVALGRNAGYSAGINAAVAHASPGSAVLVCNPDVRLRPGCGARLLRALATPATGIVVPRLEDPDGRLELSLRRDPTVLRVVGEALLGGTRAGRFHPLGEVVADPARYERPTTADWACGAVMLISRDCLERTGPWDESFFLYSEETDFALRARDGGFRLRYVPDAVAVHIGGESKVSPWLWTLLTRNRLRLYSRRHNGVSSAAFWAALTLNEALRALAGRATSRAALLALLHPGRRETAGPVPAVSRVAG